ncbi:MAG: hypothetical protein ACOX19_03190 [Fermentimonas sp.]|jgi:N-acetylglucosamine-6-phosphate deacetylase
MRTRLLTCSFVLLSILVLTGCTRNEKQNLVVEGIHYLDGTLVRIGIEDGKITNVKKIKRLSEGGRTLIIAPGLIDNQVNGYKGFSFVNIGQELTEEGIKTITSGLWEAGVTTYMPTITTNEHAVFLKNFRLLSRVKNDPDTRGSIAGFHLEGPYISPVNGFRGAHPLIYVRNPDWNEFMELYNASQKTFYK